MALAVIHSGEHPAEEVKEVGVSAAQLARQLDVPTNRVTEILNGRRAITGDTALRPPTSPVRRPNSGLTCKISLGCASRGRRLGNQLGGCRP